MVLALLALAPGARADTYPSRPIKLIVPFAAGGNGDTVARVTAAFLEKKLGSAVIVENRPGAGGLIGTNAVAKASPDGYTLCICSTGPVSVAPWTEDELAYQPQKDLQPISLITTNPLVLVVRPDLDVASGKDIIMLSKKTTKGLTYSNVGAAGLVTYSGEIFRAETGANLIAVPYRGGALATAAVAAGEVDLSFANMSDVLGQLKGKRIRAIAVTAEQRSPFLPDTPTLIEEGVMKYPIQSWNALFAPSGIDKAILARLAGIVREMRRDPDVQKAASNFGSTVVANSPEEFAALLNEETAQWGRGLTASGLVKKK
jgi:tripartite-type tricarboxylate transporter receptor subunit TctC